MLKTLKTLLISAALACSIPVSASNLPDDKTVIGFSHYTGWEAYGYIRDFGILEEVNQEFGTNIELRFYNTYDNSLAAYAGETIHGVTMTNMDALVLSTSVPTLGLINGDTSHGNDAVVAYGYNKCEDLEGEEVYLLTRSVSHYLLNRYLETCGLSDMDVIIKNNADPLNLIILMNDKIQKNEPIAVVAWNPELQSIIQNPKAEILFDSSKIEGEISDWLFVRNDDTVSENDKKALNEMWYRAMNVMTTRNAKQKEMIEFMAEFSGATTSQFVSQMKTTRFFTTKDAARNEMLNDKQEATTERVLNFIDSVDLLGDYSDTEEFGVKLADGTVIGNDADVILEMTDSYVK